MKYYFLRACYLGLDWSGWIVLIKSEILITTGMTFPVKSDKWKAPWELRFQNQFCELSGPFPGFSQISHFKVKALDSKYYPATRKRFDQRTYELMLLLYKLLTK